MPTKPTSKRKTSPPKAICVSHADTIQLIPHTSLHPSPLNPRKRLDEATLRDLSESIHAQGVLQNLVARPANGGYEIAAGERRYRAVRLLIDEGRLSSDYVLPVRIQDLSDLELLELATSENSARADMHPLEEAEAYYQMTTLGADVPSIALRMGKSESTVKQRLALHERLCDEAREGLYAGEITLAQAQQLTAASFELQRYLLERMREDREGSYGGEWTPNDIKDFLSTRLLKVRDAIFPLQAYEGEITNNLFDPEAEAAFCDTEQALALQAKAVEALKAKYLETWAWVEVIEPWQHTAWRYHTPEDGSKDPTTQGVVITADRYSWQVEVHEGVLKVDASPRDMAAGRGEATTPEAPRQQQARTPQPRDGYTRRQLILARQIKSRALQTEVAKHHRTCLILTVMGVLGSSEVILKTEQLEQHHGLAEKIPVLKAIYDRHLPYLSETFDAWESSSYPLRARSRNPQKQLALYRYLCSLPDSDLTQLFNALIAWTYGSWPTEQPDTGDSPLAREIATDLTIDMHDHFALDEDFLSLYRKAKLLAIAQELGIRLDLSGMKVKGIVAYLYTKLKGKRYLPGLLRFFEQGTEAPEGLLMEEGLEKAA